MVGYSVLGEVVCPDLVTPVSRGGLLVSVLGHLVQVGLQLYLEEFLLHHLSGSVSIPMLIPILLTSDLYLGGSVDDATCTVSGVDMLAPCPGCPHVLVLEFLLYEFELHGYLGSDYHLGGGRVQSALGLCLRHSDDLVHSTLAEQLVVCSCSSHLALGTLDAGGLGALFHHFLQHTHPQLL